MVEEQPDVCILGARALQAKGIYRVKFQGGWVYQRAHDVLGIPEGAGVVRGKALYFCCNYNGQSSGDHK